jgi:hypothetical protein
MLSGMILSKHIFTGSCLLACIPDGLTFFVMVFLLLSYTTFPGLAFRLA